MEEIAAASGLSLGTLYSVFSGKAEVFRAIHEAGDRELLRRGAQDARGIDDPLEAVLAGVRTYTEYFLTHPDFLRMHLREGATWGSAGAGAGSEARTEAWRAGVEMFARSFQRCIDAGIFVEGDPVLMARMMLAMQQVQLAHWIETGAREPHARVVAAMLEQVERSFCHRAPRPERR